MFTNLSNTIDLYVQDIEIEFDPSDLSWDQKFGEDLGRATYCSGGELGELLLCQFIFIRSKILQITQDFI